MRMRSGICWLGRQLFFQDRFQDGCGGPKLIFYCVASLRRKHGKNCVPRAQAQGAPNGAWPRPVADLA